MHVLLNWIWWVDKKERENWLHAVLNGCVCGISSFSSHGLVDVNGGRREERGWKPNKRLKYTLQLTNDYILVPVPITIPAKLFMNSMQFLLFSPPRYITDWVVDSVGLGTLGCFLLLSSCLSPNISILSYGATVA